MWLVKLSQLVPLPYFVYNVNKIVMTAQWRWTLFITLIFRKCGRTNGEFYQFIFTARFPSYTAGLHTELVLKFTSALCLWSASLSSLSQRLSSLSASKVTLPQRHILSSNVNCQHSHTHSEMLLSAIGRAIYLTFVCYLLSMRMTHLQKLAVK